MTAPDRPAGSVERRTLLLDSAIQVVGRSGLRGLTHRAVDREASVPEGTCSVSFRTRLALLTALTEHVTDRLARDVAALADGLPDLTEQPDAVIDQTTALLLRWSRHPALIVTVSELGLEAVRTPSLRDDANRWRERLADVVGAVVERGGRPAPQLRARAVVASLEGVALSALTVPEDSREHYLRSTISIVLTGLAAGSGTAAVKGLCVSP